MSDSDRAGRTATAALVPDRERASSAIYGTILVTAVIVALSEDPNASARELAEAVATTTVVFWLAHAYSDYIGRRAATRDPARWETIRLALARDVAMLGSAVLPLVALLLGAAGAVTRNQAVTIALVIGIIELFVGGFLASRGPASNLLRSVTIGLFNCVLGLAIVVLKALIH